MDLYIARFPPELMIAACAVTVAAAAWRGGPDERIGAAVVAFQAVNEYVPWLWWSIGPPADMIALAVCLPLALRSRRYWTLWALATVVLSLVTNALDTVMHLTRWSYYSAQITWYYALAGTVLFGALTRPKAPSGP